MNKISYLCYGFAIVLFASTIAYGSNTNPVKDLSQIESLQEELERLKKEQEEAEKNEASRLNSTVKFLANHTMDICIGLSVGLAIETGESSGNNFQAGLAAAGSFGICKTLGDWLFKSRIKQQKQNKKNREKRIKILENK